MRGRVWLRCIGSKLSLSDYESRKTITLGELVPGWWGERRYIDGEDS